MAASYRIAIDARPLATFRNGTTMYLTSIIEPLLEAGWDITLLTNQSLDSSHDFVSRCHVETFGPTNQFRWEQSALPNFLAQHDFDLYFSAANRGIPRRHVRPRTILGLLDIIPYKFPQLYLWRWPFHFLRHEFMAQRIAVRHADAIVTISQASAVDIKQRFKRTATPLLIKLDPIKVLPKAKIKDQFAYVGGFDPRKRLDTLLRGFAQFSATHPGFKLVLIGRGYETLVPLAKQLGINDQVVLAGYVDDGTKQTLLHQSRALVYPSMYEGYGLAIAEGFQADVPVIAGNGGAQKEIGGDAVRYINPLDPGDIAGAMAEMLDEEVAKRWREAGRRQLAHLTDPAVTGAIVAYFTHQAERSQKVPA